MKIDTSSTMALKSLISDKYNSTVKCFDTINSTNTEAKKTIQEGLVGDGLFVAHNQTEGRGRLGKSFFSPNGGLYMSIVIHPNISLSDATLITPAAAVAVVEAIQNATKKHPLIKWVNDIFIDGKKVCGILTEAVSDFEKGIAKAIIIGIGINVDKVDFPEELKEIAGSLNCPIDKIQLAADIFNRLKEICDRLPDKSFMDDYRKYSLILGKTITFNRNGKDYTSIAKNILNDGSLEVLTNENQQLILNSGEISIKI